MNGSLTTSTAFTHSPPSCEYMPLTSPPSQPWKFSMANVREQNISLKLRPEVPATGVRNHKIAQSGQARVQKVFVCIWTTSLLHWCKRGLHWCKTGLHWCKRLSGDSLSSWSEHLLHLLLTTLGNLEVSDPCSRHSGSLA